MDTFTIADAAMFYVEFWADKIAIVLGKVLETLSFDVGSPCSQEGFDGEGLGYWQVLPILINELFQLLIMSVLEIPWQ
jgi:hypothetical protein